MNDLLNYDTSWLNPALKLVIVALFVFVALVYFRSRRDYAGDLHTALSVLFWTATLAAVAALLRYFGDGTDFGFTKQFSLKWFQSLGFLAQVILYVIAGWLFAKGIVPDVRD
jgi:hypothetical protein